VTHWVRAAILRQVTAQFLLKLEAQSIWRCYLSLPLCRELGLQAQSAAKPSLSQNDRTICDATCDHMAGNYVLLRCGKRNVSAGCSRSPAVAIQSARLARLGRQFGQHRLHLHVHA
jgi:hypothetical protein